MSNRIDTKIILGQDRFKSAINTDLSINVPLDNKQKELDEFDRSVVLSLSDIFNEERQKSSSFRFTINLSFLFFNAYYGYSFYPGFTNEMIYYNPEESFQNGIWTGYPQYKEFDLMRTDNDVTGYTKDPIRHLPTDFINEESTSYNWNFFLTYPYSNDENRRLLYYLNSNTSKSWIAKDGIPFQVINPVFNNGQNLISLRCPVVHNFSVGQYVEISYGNNKFIEEVLSLGNNYANSEKYILNVTGARLSNSLPNGVLGTLKRIVDITSSAESISKYYVRKHRIITKFDDAILTRAGFEQNGFGNNFKFQYKQVTPNDVNRIVQRHGNQSYNLTFKRDIDIQPLRDNLKRPISEVFLTIINRGYFGWFHQPIGNSSVGMREGYEFNLENNISQYWSNTNNNVNLSTINTNSYTSNGVPFFYNTTLAIGDTLNGDFCEFNQYEQKEYVLSDLYHKIYFNRGVFTMDSINTQNPPGYYYKPHHKIKIREYSDYLEEGSVDDIEGVPDYAYYSESKGILIWRDLYTYGFKDENGLGVDFPFINGSHYPTSRVIFRLKPEGNVSQDINKVSLPTIDECE